MSVKLWCTQVRLSNRSKRRICRWKKMLDWTFVPVTSEYAYFLWRKHVESKKKTHLPLPSKTFQENFCGSLGSSLWRDLANFRQSMGAKMPGYETRQPWQTRACRHRANHVFWRPIKSLTLFISNLNVFFFRFVTDTRTMSIVSDVPHFVVCFMIQKDPTKSALFCLVHRDFTWSIGDVNPFCDALGLGGDSGVGAVHLAQTPGLPGLVDGSTSTHTMGLRQTDLWKYNSKYSNYYILYCNICSI